MRAVLGSFLFLVAAPGTFAVLIPWRITGWRAGPPWPGSLFFRGLGILLIVAGLPAMLDCYARFALEGLGTPAPIAPPKKLVVTGFYRFVRNPIYVSVLSLVAGQALFFASLSLLAYAALVGLAFHLFVILYEEPSLRTRFGKDYENFCANVPRWLPRLNPYRSS